MPRADSRNAIHCTSLIHAPFVAQGPVTIVHVTLDVICARFALGGIWKRMATEISAVLIRTSKKWNFLAFNTVSLAIHHLLIPGSLRFT